VCFAFPVTALDRRGCLPATPPGRVRRPERTPEAARAAVAVGARALWLQLGIRSDEARAIAEQAGLAYVEDACLKVEHARLLGRAARSQGVTGRP
jgi:hypothetical protein